MSGATAMAVPVKSLLLGYDYDVVDAVRLDILGTDPRFDHANSASWNGTSQGLPTLAYLQQFDSVLIWANYPPDGAVGDLLADYVDAGGRVVLATFWGGYEALGAPVGRIGDTGYNPFLNSTFDAFSFAELGAYNSPDPLMQGVSQLSADSLRGDYLGDWTPARSWPHPGATADPWMAITQPGTSTQSLCFPM